MIKKIKKYLPDILIVLAIWIIASSFLTSSNSISPLFTPSADIFVDFPIKNHNGAIFGFILLVIGFDIAIRRYLKNKKCKE